MKFRFVANACGVFENSAKHKILCDPWINDGVFDGSWCHFHRLKTTIDDFRDVEAIYLSHLHPDHYDDRYFDYPKDIPIITLDHGPNFLKKALNRQGFSNLVEIRDGESIDLLGFKVSMYAPFAKHNFHEASVGNLIDSALVVSADDAVCLNANDNTPTPEAMKMLRDRFGKLDLAMINYNAAGPYPACFENLNNEEKVSEHHRILKRNFDYMVELVEAGRPRFVLPFAGAYVLGGRLHTKNPYLGTTTWDECAKHIRGKLPSDSEVVLLREGDTFDVASGKSDRPYVPIDPSKVEAYISEELSTREYPYEQLRIPEKSEVFSKIDQVIPVFQDRLRKYQLAPKMKIVLQAFDRDFVLYQPDDSQGNIRCRMDERLLNEIIERRAHWNNAEIGCHIEFDRQPNEYDPDLHMGLQFFHL